ncbi:ESCRT-I subunit protein [Saccharomycopsis crataegensis]|uniref:Vacuolar protein sorting-associated protein 28 n=1 Tax=Saccharomycopsis crataegensis TaxID=43959 RepID=A0AAV5QI66_9ASCO|nr:ESCRT-I subunit protein [Saccharomycopsis crataegensis]
MSNPPPYAPVSTRVFPSHHMVRQSPALSKEITLDATSRESTEALSEIYSIIIVLDLLEKSYLKDGLFAKTKDPDTKEEVTIDTYTPTALRLLNQYNSLLKLPDVKTQFIDLNTFKKNYGLSCPLASERISAGVPATMVSSITKESSSSDKKNTGVSSRAVAEATGSFITLMDALKLNYKAKDQLYPLLSDLVTSVNAVLSDGDEDSSESETDSDDEEPTSSKKLDFEGRSKLVGWLVKLNNMKADEELNAEDTRQLLFDLETAYKNFYTCLE